MVDFAAARRMMVDGQVRTADVTDPRLIAAMLAVPREYFAPPAKRDLAYADSDLPLAASGKAAPRCLIRPMVLAKMIHALAPAPDERALIVGCASGYSAAILARLAASVVALEDDADLLRQAQAAVVQTGAANVELVRGPLPAGWPARAPYDVILIEGAIEVKPQAICGQLGEGGRLACIYPRGPAAKAWLYRRDRGEIGARPVFDAAAPLLPGFAKPVEFVF